MKKYIWLSAATEAALASIFWVQEQGQPDPVPVTVAILESGAAEKTVSCTGIIEASESRGVYADASFVPDEVLIQAGQRVQQGDVLFTVDMDATKEVLATLGGISPDQIPTDQVSREVVAPVSGIVTTLNAVAGQITDPQKPCAVISPGESIQVKISVHERDIRDLQVGQTVRVSGVAFEKDSYTGQIKSISSSARQQYTGSVSETVVDAIVSFSPEELDDSVRLGLTAKATVVVERQQEVLVVPYEYVLQDEAETEYVYVAENGRAVRRNIVTGTELKNGFQIQSGLQAGDSIIRNPEDIAESGAPITLKEAG